MGIKFQKSETAFSKQFCLNFFVMLFMQISRMKQKKLLKTEQQCIYSVLTEKIWFLGIFAVFGPNFFNIFTIFFRGSSIRLARCDSYWYLVFFFKILSFFIQICKMRHCPPSVTLALLLFVAFLCPLENTRLEHLFAPLK